MLSEYDTDKRAAMRFVYKMFDLGFHKDGNRISRNQRIAETTIKEIAFRHDLCEEFRYDFFYPDLGKEGIPECDERPLMLAVICDKFLNVDDEKDEPMIHSLIHEKGFDLKTIENATQIWEVACTILINGEYDKDYVAYNESMFLAHVLMMEDLYDLEENIESYDSEDMIKVLEQDFPPARKFLRPDTDIGKELEAFLNSAEEMMRERIEPRTAKPMHLRLATVEGARVDGHIEMPEPRF